MDILEFDGVVYNTNTIIEDAKKLETVEEQVIYVKREINKIDKFDRFDLFSDYYLFEEDDPQTQILHNGFVNFIKEKKLFIKELSSELEKLKGSHVKEDNGILLKVKALVNIYTTKEIFKLTTKGTMHFNKYVKKVNRIGRESNRIDSAHEKILEQTITYLESNNYEDALKKAKNELKEFENNLA